MEFSPETKIAELVETYSWMLEYLPTISPKFKWLKKPVQREKMLKRATIEIASIAAGLTSEEFIGKLEAEITRREKDVDEVPSPPAGHPVHTLMIENRAYEDLFNKIEVMLKNIGPNPDMNMLLVHGELLSEYIEQLSQIERRFLRIENQLFPKLEAHDFTGPSDVMWKIHDEVRADIKKARKQVADGDPGAINTLRGIAAIVSDLIYKEEHILFPYSLDILTESEWVEVLEGEKEIGYSWVEPVVEWKPVVDKEEKKIIDKIDLDVGVMTPKQVNLMLKHLPFDMTFVGEDDKVAYYSGGKERIFPRSPGIIGRAVSRCHPPKSVHIVNNIVEAFKDGSKDEAEFWLQLGGKFIHIRYFAVRDEDGKYQGTVEVSQDITEIKKLVGEQRLLDWAS